MSTSGPSQSVALVGGTGNLGRLVAHALVDRGADLRLLVRPESRARAADLESLGATVVEGTLGAGDERALADLLAGADAVVSAVQGGPDVLVDGQLRLLGAAREAGVRRLVPSDYSFDFFRLAEGANPNSDWRRQFASAAADARGGVEVVHVLNGCFLDRRVLFGFLGAIDLEQGVLHLWGDGAEPMDLTTYADTAAYTAEVALDRDPVPRVFGVAGDVVDVPGLVRAYQEGSGASLRVEERGSLADLDALIAARQREAPENLYAYLPLMYWRAMLNGEGKIESLQNERYPSVRPTGVATYVAREGL